MENCKADIAAYCINCSDKEICGVKNLVRLIKYLSKNNFHGNLIVPFKGGKFGKIKKEEIIDLNERGETSLLI